MLVYTSGSSFSPFLDLLWNVLHCNVKCVYGTCYRRICPNDFYSIALHLKRYMIFFCRLDSLVGLFSAGCQPSSSNDPFGLRRISYGLVSITYFSSV